MQHKFKRHLSCTFPPFFCICAPPMMMSFTGRFSDTIRSARSRAFALARA